MDVGHSFWSKHGEVNGRDFIQMSFDKLNGCFQKTTEAGETWRKFEPVNFEHCEGSKELLKFYSAIYRCVSSLACVPTIVQELSL